VTSAESIINRIDKGWMIGTAVVLFGLVAYIAWAAATFGWATRCITIESEADARYAIERYLRLHASGLSELYRIADLDRQIANLTFLPRVMMDEPPGLRHVGFRFDNGCGATFQARANLDPCGRVELNLGSLIARRHNGAWRERKTIGNC
jgi:hypothetical protein